MNDRVARPVAFTALLVLLTGHCLWAARSVAGIYIGQPFSEVKALYAGMKVYGQQRYQCTPDLHVILSHGRVSQIVLVTNAYTVCGVQVGDSAESLLSRIGKPSEKRRRALDNHAQAEELWEFNSIGLTLLLREWQSGWRIEEIRID